MSQSDPMLVLVRDLMFSGRISAEAKAQGVAVKIVRDPGKLIDEPGNRLIVDLNQGGALEAAVQWKAENAGEVIGFVAHVDAETIQRARSAGIEQVLTRGQFVAKLSQLLSGSKPD